MRTLPLLLILPALVGAAPPADKYDGNALLECRQTREGADAVRKTFKELSHRGGPGSYEFTYDVAKYRPLGTSKPKLHLTMYENQYGALDKYEVTLNGKYPAILTRLLQVHGKQACDKSGPEKCSFEAGDTYVELAIDPRDGLMLTCSYEEDN